MPVYSRGGIAVSTLFKDYVTKNTALNLRGEKHKFRKISKLLCSEGKIKTGLSSCFFKLRDCGKVMDGMSKILGGFTNVVGIGYNDLPDVSNDSKYLLEEWKNVEIFLQCEHSANHVTIDSTFNSQCCRCTLNAISECTHQHDVGSCKLCCQHTCLLKKIK